MITVLSYSTISNVLTNLQISEKVFSKFQYDYKNFNFLE